MTACAQNRRSLVSVIIPTYNRAKYVRNALESVLAQTYTELEVIVVDDASTDDTEMLLATVADPRVRYIRHTRNLGGSAARNTGIAAARGEYIAFLDSDDEWLPSKLEEQVRVFSTDEDCGVVYTEMTCVDSDGNTRTFRRRTVDGDILSALLIENVVGSSSTVLVRKQCLESAGYFDTTLRSCQDWDMWVRLARKCKFRAIRKPLVLYRWHGDQISGTPSALISGHLAMLDKYRSEIAAIGRWVVGHRYFTLGSALCRVGSLQAGRRMLLRAIAWCPWKPRYWFYFVATLLGRRGYDRLVHMKRVLQEANRRLLV